MHTRLSRLLVLLAAGMAVLLPAAAANDPEDLYFEAYRIWKDAETLMSQGKKAEAREQYKEAETRIADIQEKFPGWQPDIVKYRLKAIRNRLTELVPPDLTPPPPPLLPLPKPDQPDRPYIPTIKPDPQYLQRPKVPFMFNGQLYHKMLLNGGGDAAPSAPTPLLPSR